MYPRFVEKFVYTCVSRPFFFFVEDQVQILVASTEEVSALGSFLFPAS